MVVVGTQNIMVIHKSYRLKNPLPEAIMATCNFVRKMLLKSIISTSNYTFIACIVEKHNYCHHCSLIVEQMAMAFICTCLTPLPSP